MFWHKKTIQDMQLGLLTFCNGEWATGPLATAVGNVILSIEGDQASPNRVAIDNAKDVVANPKDLVERAISYIRGHSRAREYMQQGALLELDGFSFSAIKGKFIVIFGLEGWPDTIFNVQFDTGMPVNMWLND